MDSEEVTRTAGNDLLRDVGDDWITSKKIFGIVFLLHHLSYIVFTCSYAYKLINRSCMFYGLSKF